MNKAKIIIDSETHEFDILEPTKGSKVIDISTLHAKTGHYTLDIGLTCTASCKSEITYIDGAKGELLHRGIAIEELADKHTYLETCFLLLNSRLPSKEELVDFDLEIRHRSFVDEGFKDLFRAFPKGSHPMATLSSAVAALSTFYFDHLDIDTKKDGKVMAHRLIAKMPTLCAFAYRHSLGIPYVQPDVNRSFTENFLYMMRAYPNGRLKVTKDGEEVIRDIEIKALDTIFTLHADHEQNASTTTVRTVASTGAHPYAAVSAGIDALWGRAHGGANESVIGQLEMIGSIDRVDEFIARAKDPNDSFKLMGFGHRVYKNFDPRAKALKKLQDELKDELNLDSHLMEIAHKIEQIALSDEYFIKRNLYPNIDFYSGIILTALRIPKLMFTPIFVIGRTVGWLTQFLEMKEDEKQKIVRPRQLYLGQ
jgi:citrate synthase